MFEMKAITTATFAVLVLGAGVAMAQGTTSTTGMSAPNAREESKSQATPVAPPTSGYSPPSVSSPSTSQEGKAAAGSGGSGG